MVSYEGQATAANGPAEQDAQASTAEWRRLHECLLEKCEKTQDELLQKLVDAHPGSDDVSRLDAGDTVLLCMNGRKHNKLSAPWAGPYVVLDRVSGDEGTNVLLVQHLATKIVTRVHARDLKACSLEHFSTIDDALPLAALDSFEYAVERILSHRPAGRRKLSGKRARPKSDYEFEVLWANLPLENGENPSWESWSNVSLRSCEAYKLYCLSPEVTAELGADFYAGEADADNAQPTIEGEKTSKRQRSNQR